ncbi:MAG: lytic transglycosylase domain-containing protein [bacterium]|nr:lytic transglycosylase domain-containing protein [bacterium]
MKKGFYVGLFIALVAAFILNLKKIEQPKKPEVAKQQQGEIESPPTATSTAIPESLSLKFYKELPDDIYFCGEHLILDENKKRTLADVMDAEIKGLSSDSIREIRNNMWFSYIRNELKAGGLHDDLKYVPIAESRLSPTAESSEGAMGPWQLMPGTADRFDLTIIPKDYDERCDFVKSTEAAIEYLQELHKEFKNWSAALAAYNTGEENLRKAMEAKRTRDFYQLKTLHPETQAFPFRVMATKLIFKNPEKYGFSREGWLSESVFAKWEITEVSLNIDDEWMHIDQIIQGLKENFPDWDPSQFMKYNPHILDSLFRGKYKVYLVKESGTS